MKFVSSFVLIIIISMVFSPLWIIKTQGDENSDLESDQIFTQKSIEIVDIAVNERDKQEIEISATNSIVNSPIPILRSPIDESSEKSLALETSGFTSYNPVISVQELDAPTLGTPQPGDPSYEMGTTGNTIKWKPNDVNPHTYAVYANGTFLNNNTWANGFVFTNIDGLTLGFWNITVVFSDTFSNLLIVMRWGTVFDSIAPSILGPNDLTYTEGTTGNSLAWNSTDLNPDNYEVRRDGLLVDSGTWDSPSNATTNIDGLNAGTYTYSFTAFDTTGNQFTDSAIVTVTDDPNIPSFTLAPSNTTISELSPGNFLTWNATDNNPDNYTIYQDGVINATGFWTNPTLITLNLDSLALGLYNFTIILDDITPTYIITNTLFVSVTDQTLPSIDSSPGNQLIVEDSTGNLISWDVSDLHNTTYEILKDLVLIDDGNWTSGGSISIIIDGLAIGIYSYELRLYDDAGNQNIDTIFVEIQDLTKPLLDSSSVDFSYNEGAGGQQIFWNVTDKYEGTYQILQNGSIVASASWTNANDIVWDLLVLEASNYNFTLIAVDFYGNQLVNTILVSVIDIIFPVFGTGPGNTTYTEGTSTLFVSWTSTDNHATQYNVLQDGALVGLGFWISGSAVSHNIGGLSQGIYNFTIIFYDVSNNLVFDTIFVTVEDKVNPVFTSTPGNLDYSNGTTGNELQWIATDNHPDYYEIRKEGSIIDTDSWISSGTISINVDTLALGTYNYTITIYDESGNFNVNQLNVTVSTKPVFISIPTTTDYLNNTVNILTWVPSDADPDYYEIYQNDGLIQTNTWLNAISITLNVTNFVLGIHNVTIFIYDDQASSNRHTIWITITDFPVIQSSPASNVNYSEGITDFDLDWTATDVAADRYLLYINDVLDKNETWTSGVVVSIEAGGLLKGTYNYTIIFIDSTNNENFDTVIVTVTDDTSPIFASPFPSNTSFEQGSPDRFLDWNVTDNYADRYVILLNGSNYKSGTWFNATLITINIDDLTYGTHNLTIIVFDESNNNVTDEIIVNVLDTTIPVVLDAGNQIYSEGSTGNFIGWNATDFNPLNYSVTLDSVDYTNGTWVSGEFVNIDIDDLAIGNYTFEIKFYDVELLFISEIVNVTVVDSTKPVMLSPGDQIYSEGSSNNRIYWNASDTNANNFEAYVNGSSSPILIDSGTWNSLSLIEINIDGLSFGTHIITLVVNDRAGNQVNQSVFLTVVDDALPTINPTSNLIYEEGSVSNILIWNATDMNPGSYVIRLNGSFEFSGTWISKANITFNIDELPFGTYLYMITFFDSSGNEALNTIIVTVIDTTKPTFSSTPSNADYSEGTNNNAITWIVNDNHPLTYSIYSNMIEIRTDISWASESPITIDINGLDKGIYNFTIFITDQNGNFNNHTIFVEVFDDSVPSFLVVANSPNSYNEETPGYNLIWVPVDKYNSTYIVFIDEVEYQTGNWNSGDISKPILVNIDGLLKGTHNITLIVYDESFNLIKSMFDVIVNDVISPILNEVPASFEFNEGTIGNSVVWDVTDNYPASYTVFVDNVVNETGNWINEINFDLDYLLAGSYNITITVNDESSNSISHSIIVTVIDKTDPIFVSEFVNVFYELDTDGNFLIIAVFDNNPNSFIIYIDDKLDQSGSWNNENEIRYNIDGLSFGEHNFTILINDVSGNTLTESIIVKVTSPLITETVRPEFEITQIVYEADKEIVTNFWYDINGTGIDNATVELVLLQNNRILEEIPRTFYSDANGQFIIMFNYTGVESGNYTWTVTFLKNEYETKTLSFDVEVAKHSYRIEFEELSDLKPGKDFFISATVYYDDDRSTSYLSLNSLGLNQFIPKDGTAEDISVSFDLVLEHFNTGETRLELESTSDNNGVVFVILSAGQTNNLKSINAISASIKLSDTGNSVIVPLVQSNLPRVLEPEATIVEKFIDFVEENSISIISIILLLIAGLIVYSLINRRRNKRYKQILKGLQNGKTEFEGILSLQAILIMSKGGIPLFEERYEDFDVNPTLVAGMSSAISAFFNEFGTSDKLGFETIERSGMSITSHKSPLSTIVILSTFRQPDIILEQIQEVQMLVENRFNSIISKSFHTSLLPSDKIYEEFEKADFKIALKGKIKINKRNLRKIQKIKSISRNLKENLASIEQFTESMDNKDTDLSLRDIMNYLSDREVANDIVAKLILLAYKHEIILSAG